MSSTPPEEIRVEHLGIALDALGWQPSLVSSRAATRAEMLGLLRFIVDAELLALAGDPTIEQEATAGYMTGLDTRSRQGARTDQEYANKYLTLWMNLIAMNVRRAGTEATTALDGADSDFGSAQVAEALMMGVLQLMRIPATRDETTGQRGGAPVVRVALSKTGPFLREARERLETSRRKLKQLGK
jgi:hypothetical protein